MDKVLNHDVVLMGPIRLRQQRTTTTSCPLQASSPYQRYAQGLANTNATTCQQPYLDSSGVGTSSERRAFNTSWHISANIPTPSAAELANLSTSQAPWTYRETDGIPYVGWQATYKSGGYYVDLPVAYLNRARRVTADLRDRRWLDNSTTVLLVDFVLYNAQVNLFVVVKVVFEALSAGGISYVQWLYPLNLYQYSGNNAMFAYAVQAIWIFVLLTHVVKIILQIKRQGWREFRKNWWNLLDLFQILISLCLIGVFAARIYVVIETITKMQNNHNVFVDMDLLVNWEDLMLNLYGITFFLTLMLFFRNLSFNKFWAMFLGTLSNGKYDLISFIIMFTMITLFFGCLGFLQFGASSEEFGTYSAAFMTLIQNVIGVVGPLMSMAKKTRAMAFCFFYSIIVMFLAVQVFMSIVNTVYGAVTADAEKMTDWDEELADYLYKEWKSMFEATHPVMVDDEDAPVEMYAEDDVFAMLQTASNSLHKAVDKAVDQEEKEARLLWSVVTEKGCQWFSENEERRPVIKSARCFASSLDVRNNDDRRIATQSARYARSSLDVRSESETTMQRSVSAYAQFRAVEPWVQRRMEMDPSMQRVESALSNFTDLDTFEGQMRPTSNTLRVPDQTVREGFWSHMHKSASFTEFTSCDELHPVSTVL